jgi:hypothetical protein
MGGVDVDVVLCVVRGGPCTRKGEGVGRWEGELKRDWWSGIKHVALNRNHVQVLHFPLSSSPFPLFLN